MENLFFYFDAHLSESLNVGPNFKAGDPFAQNSFLSSKGDSKNMGVFSSKHFLQALIASGTYCIRQKACYLNTIATYPINHLYTK